MSVQLPEPLLVEDAHEEWWRTRTPEYRDTINEWLASEGIDGTDLTRVEAYLVDAPFARLWFRVRDEEGRCLLNEARDEVLKREETQLLSSLPPRLE